MASDENEPKSELDREFEALLDAIKADAATVADGTAIDSLRERIDSLELLVEEFGQARELQNDLGEYVRDLKYEVSDIRKFRYWVTALSIVMSVVLFSLLVVYVVITPKWFLVLDGSLQVPFIISLGAGSVYLMSLNLRGIYRSRHERNHGEMLPEAVKVGLEALRKN